MYACYKINMFKPNPTKPKPNNKTQNSGIHESETILFSLLCKLTLTRRFYNAYSMFTYSTYTYLYYKEITSLSKYLCSTVVLITRASPFLDKHS